MQYVVFCVWLLSLSIVSWRFIYVGACLSTLFFLIVKLNSQGLLLLVIVCVCVCVCVEIIGVGDMWGGWEWLVVP